MSSKHAYDLVVVVDEYKDQSGNTKKKWLTVGRVYANDNGYFAVVDAHVNLAAIPRKGSGVMVSFFEPKDQSSGASSIPGRRTPNPPPPSDFDDDVPFS